MSRLQWRCRTDQIEQPALSDQPAPATCSPQGSVITPGSSVARPEDAGRYAHTNHLIFVPQGGPLASIMPSFSFAETPASLGCVYHVGPIYAGCKPATGGKNHPTGGWGAIALVDAYDNPKAASDLASSTRASARPESVRRRNVPPFSKVPKSAAFAARHAIHPAAFSSHFDLPAASSTKVYANRSFGTLNGITASCSGVPAGDMDWVGKKISTSSGRMPWRPARKLSS